MKSFHPEDNREEPTVLVSRRHSVKNPDRRFPPSPKESTGGGGSQEKGTNSKNSRLQIARRSRGLWQKKTILRAERALLFGGGDRPKEAGRSPSQKVPTEGSGKESKKERSKDHIGANNEKGNPKGPFVKEKRSRKQKRRKTRFDGAKKKKRSNRAHSRRGGLSFLFQTAKGFPKAQTNKRMGKR